MVDIVDAERLEQKRKAVIRARSRKDKHAYFEGVAEARFVLRKVFRMVEDVAKQAGLDPLAHQALIQIYGSADMSLRIKDLAERLDIAPAFASSLIKILSTKGLIKRTRAGSDIRAVQLTVTPNGIELLHQIDSSVKIHVDYFAVQLSPAQREAAVSILMFYVGLSLDTTANEA
ncbi:MAG: regulatory protein MarR [Hyphomicrobiales bacterium]|nr:regulatory protein MarR [Hyphomicrobiales bacterium]